MTCLGVGRSGCPMDRWITSFMVDAIFTIRRMPGTGIACIAGFQGALALRYFIWRTWVCPESLAASAISTSHSREWMTDGTLPIGRVVHLSPDIQAAGLG